MPFLNLENQWFYFQIFHIISYFVFISIFHLVLSKPNKDLTPKITWNLLKTSFIKILQFSNNVFAFVQRSGFVQTRLCSSQWRFRYICLYFIYNFELLKLIEWIGRLSKTMFSLLFLFKLNSESGLHIFHSCGQIGACA